MRSREHKHMTTFRKAIRRALFDQPERRRILTRLKRYAGDRGAYHDDLALAVMARALQPNSNCVDVGCHDGLYLDEMLRLAPAGEHHAFEPIPVLAERLRQRYRGREQVRVHQLALSDHAGSSDFHFNHTNPGWSGLRRRAYPRADDVVETMPVATRPLDEVLSRDGRVDFIKVDVEGAEFAVLSGAREVLRRCRPVVVFEYGLGSAEYYEAWPEAMFDLLDGIGYRIWPLERSGMADASLSGELFTRHFHEGLGYYFVARP